MDELLTFVWQMAVIMVEMLPPSTDPLSLLGLMCLTCSPSEGVGSLIALFAEADLTLDILLIVVVNLAALGTSSTFFSVIFIG